METNNSSTNERRNSKRTFIFWAIGGIAVAGALTAGFMLGGRAGGPADTADAGVQTSITAPAGNSGAADEGLQAGGGQGNVGGQAVEPGGSGEGQLPVTETPEPSEEPEDEADDPTVTPDPDDDGCNFCEDDGDLAPQPTSTPSCAFCPEGLDLVAETPEGPDPCFPDCIADVDLGQAVDDTGPKFESITTDFCYPVLQVYVEVDAPAEVWFEYSYDGHEYESVHMDADNEAVIARDMGFHSWDVYFIGFYFVHAIDLSGNHSVSEAQTMPDPDLGC
jgi:hypothetical protein